MTEKDIEKAFGSSRNLFVTGAAGTGKSHMLNEYIASRNNVLVCAPTGIAALNLNGDTMHRLFHIPVPSYANPSFAKSNKKAVPASTLKLLAMADTVVIDEISMARADVFRYAIKVLRRAEKLKGGKIRVIVSGDFSQLPPVVRKGDDKLLKKAGLDPSGFPFTTAEWKSLNFKTVELLDIKRQDDREFIGNLGDIRRGTFTNLGYFDRFVGDMSGFEDAVYICGTNAEADRMNMEYLDSLPGSAAAYMARRDGHVPAGMVDDVVLLKPGARVIFTANDNVRNQYRNGSFGTVVATGQDAVTVDVDGKAVVVRPREWPVMTYTGTGGKLAGKQIGSVRQVPLKLARAITIHRSQGQTFDRVVVNPDVFAPGQLYVSLSRVRGPDGLRLTRPLKPEDLILDPTVQRFYANGCKWEPAKPSHGKPDGTKSVGKSAKQSGAGKSAAKTVADLKRRAGQKQALARKTGAKSSAKRTGKGRKTC